MFAPHQHDLIVLSDIGVLLWIAGIVTWTYHRGFAEVFVLYLVPYLWCAFLDCHMQQRTLTLSVF
jgi:omega-6 fatty acid desaturase (delta-12 desaturase)